MDRVNPFEELAAFDTKPVPKSKPVDPAVIERVAQDNNFPSRQPVRATSPSLPESGRRAPRRYTTGRNKQLNIKAKDETIERFYRLADQRQVPLGELFELAIDALERSTASGAR